MTVHIKTGKKIDPSPSCPVWNTFGLMPSPFVDVLYVTAFRRHSHGHSFQSED